MHVTSIRGATLFVENKVGINFYVDFGGMTARDRDGHRMVVGLNTAQLEAQNYTVRIFYQNAAGSYLDANGRPITESGLPAAYTDVPFRIEDYNFLTIDGITHPVFRFTFWAHPYNMADSVVAVLCENGRPVKGVGDEEAKGLRYSIARYAEAMLDKTAAGDNIPDNDAVFVGDKSEAKLRTMLVHMLNYGGASLRYAEANRWGSTNPWRSPATNAMAYNKTGANGTTVQGIARRVFTAQRLQNAGLEAELAASAVTDPDALLTGAAEQIAQYATVVTVDGVQAENVEAVLEANGITFRGISLKLEEGGSVTMQLRFFVGDGAEDAPGLQNNTIRLTMADGSGALTPITLYDAAARRPDASDWDGTFWSGKWGQNYTRGEYVFNIENIPVYNWDQPFTFSFTVDDKEYSFQYSVMSYANSMVGGQDADLSRLLKAMYNYTAAASDYFGSVYHSSQYTASHHWSYHGTYHEDDADGTTDKSNEENTHIAPAA